MVSYFVSDSHEVMTAIILLLLVLALLQLTQRLLLKCSSAVLSAILLICCPLFFLSYFLAGWGVWFTSKRCKTIDSRCSCACNGGASNSMRITDMAPWFHVPRRREKVLGSSEGSTCSSHNRSWHSSLGSITLRLAIISNVRKCPTHCRKCEISNNHWSTKSCYVSASCTSYLHLSDIISSFWTKCISGFTKQACSVETDSSNYYPCCGHWCGFLIYFSSAIAGQPVLWTQSDFYFPLYVLCLGFCLYPGKPYLKWTFPSHASCSLIYWNFC